MAWLNFNDIPTLTILVTVIAWVFTQIRSLEKRDDEKFAVLKDHVDKLQASLDNLSSEFRLDNKDEQLVVNHLTSMIQQLRSDTLYKRKMIYHRLQCVDLALKDIHDFLKKSGFHASSVCGLSPLSEEEYFSDGVKEFHQFNN